MKIFSRDFTLKEKKFVDLMSLFEQDHQIHKIPCPKLVRLVEENQIHNQNLINETLKSYLPDKKIDSLVLGCTHFVFFRNDLETMFPDISIIDGNLGTARHLKDILMNRNLLNDSGGNIQFENSLPSKITLSKELFSYLNEN